MPKYKGKKKPIPYKSQYVQDWHMYQEFNSNKRKCTIKDNLGERVFCFVLCFVVSALERKTSSHTYLLNSHLGTHQHALKHSQGGYLKFTKEIFVNDPFSSSHFKSFLGKDYFPIPTRKYIYDPHTKFICLTPAAIFTDTF